MIQIVYHRLYHRVTVEGHAESAEFGHDLICASCSSLARTLAENVMDLEQSGAVRDVTVDLMSGKAEIACNPVTKFRSIVTMIYDSICTGFAILARDYPEFVTLVIQG